MWIHTQEGYDCVGLKIGDLKIIHSKNESLKTFYKLIETWQRIQSKVNDWEIKEKME